MFVALATIAMVAAGGCRPVAIDPDLWGVAVARDSTAARLARPGPGPAFPEGDVGGQTARSSDGEAGG
eukprot:6435283-Alexandrium_andersonii.AAC.1